MLADIMKQVGKVIGRFKDQWYGRTFYCPVCHLELSEHDVDEKRLPGMSPVQSGD